MALKFAEDALRVAKSAFGLTGVDAATTQLEDAVARQSIDISRIADRGQAFGLGDGLFSCIITQIHTAGGSLLEGLDVYSPASVFGPLPLVTPKDRDWWFLGAGVTIGSTSQTSIDEVQFIRDPVQTAGSSDGTLGNEHQMHAR